MVSTVSAKRSHPLSTTHSSALPSKQTCHYSLVSSPHRYSAGKSLVTKINENFFPKTFQEEALQNTANFWHTQAFHEWPVQQGHLADEQAQAHLWPTLTQMETTDSNPGSLTALPTHPRNPATLSSPWSPLVLISSFPPCFPKQAGLLLAIFNNTEKFLQQNSQYLSIWSQISLSKHACLRRGPSNMLDLMGHLCCQTPGEAEVLLRSMQSAILSYHLFPGLEGRNKKKIKKKKSSKSTDRSFVWAACLCAARCRV